MRTIIEFHEFIKKADKLFGAEEREKIVSFLSSNPKAGKKIVYLGGIRKLQWRDNSAHSIYFHQGTNNLPLVIISIFRKNEKLVLDKLIEVLLHNKLA